jgi:hypothetical protein
MWRRRRKEEEEKEERRTGGNEDNPQKTKEGKRKQANKLMKNERQGDWFVVYFDVTSTLWIIVTQGLVKC